MSLICVSKNHTVILMLISQLKAEVNSQRYLMALLPEINYWLNPMWMFCWDVVENNKEANQFDQLLLACLRKAWDFLSKWATSWRKMRMLSPLLTSKIYQASPAMMAKRWDNQEIHVPLLVTMPVSNSLKVT